MTKGKSCYSSYTDGSTHEVRIIPQGKPHKFGMSRPVVFFQPPCFRPSRIRVFSMNPAVLPPRLNTGFPGLVLLTVRDEVSVAFELEAFFRLRPDPVGSTVGSDNSL